MRAWRLAVAAVGAVSVVAASMLIAPQTSRADASQFDMSKPVYGPNEIIYVEYGILTRACDFTFTASDIYVVPAGFSGGALNDVSGAPNTFVTGLIGSPVEYEQVGITGPDGSIPSGTYDLVEDSCQNGQFDAGEDSILRNAFTVDTSLPVPGLPAADIAAMKQEATELQEHWTRATAAMTALVVAYTLAGTATTGPEAVQYLIFEALYGVVENRMGITRLWTLQGAVDAPADQALHFRGLAADPPRSDFTDATALPSSAMGVYPPESDFDAALYSWLTDMDQSNRLAEALLEALEKYQGAQQANDGAAALAQARSAAALSELLADALDQQVASGAAVGAAETAAGIDMADRWAQTKALQDTLRSSGLDSATRQLLERVGIDAAAQSQSLAEFLAIDLSGQSTTFGATIADGNATAPATAASMRSLAAAMDTLADGLQQSLATQSVTIYPEPVVTAPASGVVGSTITVSVAAPGATSFAWDLDADGDFDDATGAQASIVPAWAGSRSVQVRATGPAGSAVGYAVVDVAAKPGAKPVLAPTPAPATIIQVDEGDSVTLTAGASDPDGDPVAVTWRLTDSAVTATGESFQVVGDPAARIRAVQAVASDPAGHAASALWVVITPVVLGGSTGDEPTAGFGFDPVAAVPGGLVVFTDESQAASGRSIVAWEWDLDGDGVVDSSVADPRWTYSALGPVTVSLTVTDSEGDQDTVSRELVVSNPSYVSLYPVAGTMSSSQVTVRVKAWSRVDWSELGGADVVV
ncbi:MAG: hypothetical protein LBS27_11595, partial [Bifidobacteriaceae bacterium]|nr:hypothetical protein [Bifidobacteriaceae bacterium]